MGRMFLLVFTFIFCFLWAEVKVEKVLETTSIKEYNQWVKKNKRKYPELKPIYIQHKMIKSMASRVGVDYEPERTFDPPSTNPFTNEYNVWYYDEDGDIIKQEIIRGYVAVKVSLNFDELLITRSDHPWYPQNRINIVKDRRGNVKFTLDNVFSLRLTGAELYIEKPDIFVGATSLRLFNKNGIVIGKLEGASFSFYDDMPTYNVDKRVFVEGYLKQSNLPPGLLFLYTQNGDVLWCKEFTWPERVPWGLYPSISGNGEVIAVGHVNTAYVYYKNGKLWREYKYEHPFPAITALSYDGRYLAIATREAGTKIFLYNNVNGELIWDAKVEAFKPTTGGLFPIVVSSNGRYVALTLRPDRVYLFGDGGEILKEWNLQGIVTYPMASPGERVKITLGVFTILQFVKDLLIIKYTKDIPDINTEFSYIIERVVENE